MGLLQSQMILVLKADLLPLSVYFLSKNYLLITIPLHHSNNTEQAQLTPLRSDSSLPFGITDQLFHLSELF